MQSGRELEELVHCQRELTSRTFHSHDRALARTLPMIRPLECLEHLRQLSGGSLAELCLESAALLVGRGQEPPSRRRHFAHPRASLGVKPRVRGREPSSRRDSLQQERVVYDARIVHQLRNRLTVPFDPSDAPYVPCQRKLDRAPGCVDIFVRLGHPKTDRERGITERPGELIAQNRRAVAAEIDDKVRHDRSIGGATEQTDQKRDREDAQRRLVTEQRRFLSSRRLHREAYGGGSRDHRGQGDRRPSRDSATRRSTPTEPA